jgi:hypothetical protein
MGKNALREIIDLSNISEEDRLKLQTNLVKSAAAPEQHRGFVQAMKSAGLSGSLMVKDSLAEKTEVKSELVEEEIETEAATEVVEEVEVEKAADEVVETEVATEPEKVVEPVVGEVEKAATESTVQPAAITPELLKQFVSDSVANAIQPLQSELEKSQAKAAKLEQELTAARQSESVLQGLGKLLGKTESTPEKKSTMTEFPNVNKIVGAHSDKIEGRLAEFMQVRDASNVQYRQTPKGLVPMYPTYKLDSWMADLRSDRKAFKHFLEEEMTEMGRKHGMFRGNKMITEGERRAATTASDIPGGFLDVLSSIMRTNARPGLVFWQFPTTVHQYEKGQGDTIVIPRAAYPPTATDSNERLLSGGNTYVPIDNSNQRVNTGIIRMNLNEYGRGRSEAPPISIPTFVESYSMLPLLSILQRDLFYDYYNWEDLIIREQWRPTSKVYYNNGDEIATTAAGVMSNGQMTRKFLGGVYTQLANDRVIPLADGNYGLVTNPTAIRQLKNSMTEFWQAPTADEVQALTNILLSDYPNGEDLRIQGYQGLYEGFHIFQTNSFANGGNGTEGVLNESVNSGGTVTTATMRTSYAFGYAASGRGIGGSGVQILFDEKTDFGRLDRAIWQSYESHGPLDVDAAGYGENLSDPNRQETRVFRVCTSDQLID